MMPSVDEKKESKGGQVGRQDKDKMPLTLFTCRSSCLPRCCLEKVQQQYSSISFCISFFISKIKETDNPAVKQNVIDINA